MLFRSFYDIRLSPADLDTIYRVQSEIITPAELSKIMFENFTDYQKTIKHLLELSENQVTKESELVYSEDEVEDVISEAGTSSITGSNENTHISNTQIEIKPDDENQQKSPDFKEKMLEYRSIIIKEVFKRYQVIWDSSNNTRFCAKDLIQQLLYNLDEKVFKSDTFLEYSNSRYNIEKTHPEYLKSQNQNQNFVWYFVPRNNEIKNYDMEICKELKIHMKTLYSMISKVISEMAFSRGLHTGWFEGVNNQALVHAQFAKKRGVYLGRVVAIEPQRILLERSSTSRPYPLKPGDGVVFERGDRNQDQEVGGRIYEVIHRGDRECWLSFSRKHFALESVQWGDRVWKTNDPDLDQRIRRTYQGDQPQYARPLWCTVSGSEGSPLRVTLTDEEGVTVTVTSTIPLTAAVNQPLTSDRLREQLGRLGNTLS